MNKSELIAALKGTERPRRLVVDEQSAQDIVDEVCLAHKEHASDYDLISHYFEGGSVFDICQRLWNFCKNKLTYVVESSKVQNVGCPYWILTHGVIDCKNFASFIAGNLDSMKRRGLKIIWEFRFISDRPFSLLDRDPDHVFVVANPNTDDIWIDPVLNYFDYHIMYFYRTSKRVKTMGRNTRLGAIGGMGCDCGIGGAAIGASAENNMLADAAAYANGLSAAMNQTIKTNLLNLITQTVLEGVSVYFFDGIAVAALALLKLGSIGLDKLFGVGSESARILTDLSSLNIIGMVETIINGRTYQSDNYWAAVYYQFYVLGNNITDPDHVTDNDVLPALKWFIDRAGVFISGREHIIGLTTSATAYENYHSVNADTTTDMTLVNAASLMAKKYWPNPGNFSSSMKGAWAATAGVYDAQLIAIANSYGQTPEEYVKGTGTADAVAEQYTAANTTPAVTTTPSVMNFLTANTIVPGVPNALIFGLGAGAIILLTSNNKR